MLRLAFRAKITTDSYWFLNY